ncbi:MAG: xanthine dehydrogenase accessory factor [Solirubrobacteraceae bacterium]|jgi:xanthine dehydrogenase accessory factor|nr:xanthine dehydrogenase accessory factor [Solirubrobacteraceae bacterium]
MKDVLTDLDAWTATGAQVALGTVVGVKLSAPRPPGAKMAINDRGEVTGAVSGGCVEGAVVEIARGVLEGDPPQLVTFGIDDDEAWDVGLPCGGEITVWVSRHQHPEFARIAREGGRAALATIVAGEGLGDTLLVRADGSFAGTLGTPELDAAARAAGDRLMWEERSEPITVEGRQVFVDSVYPSPRIIAVGAVDFARQLCRVARALGWRPYVVDPRGFFSRADRFPEAEQVVTAWPAEGFATLGVDRATAIAILTHDPKLDDAALMAALDTDASYIGAMGSRRAQEVRLQRLLDRGLTEDAMERVAAPIGLDLGALTAEETALSIMSEVIALRHGRDGGRLKYASGRIHEVG